jgi:hypothetical protein
MQNKYFGELSDYRKYGLIRLLTNYGKMKIAVCWMLTVEQNNYKPEKTRKYLLPKYQTKYRRCDPQLYDFLKLYSDCKYRDVGILEKPSGRKIVKRCKFYNDTIPDNWNDRMKYFQKFGRQKAKGMELIFFDPDNGIETEIVKKKCSQKHLYWCEMRKFQSTHSLLIFQWFPRKKHKEFLRDNAKQLKDRLGVKRIFSYSAGTCAYFLIPQPRHIQRLTRVNNEIRKRWKGQIIVKPY